MTTQVKVVNGASAYTWTQTNESITISFSVRNVLMKNIDFAICDNYVKINISSDKYFQSVDLAHEIRFEDPKNRVNLLDTHLEMYLIKASP